MIRAWSSQARPAPRSTYPISDSVPLRRSSRRPLSPHPLPRPPAHLRDAPALQGRPSKVRSGTIGTRYHCDNAGHLQPRAAQHGRSDRTRYAGRALPYGGCAYRLVALVYYWCTGAGLTLGSFFVPVLNLQTIAFSEWAMLGSNQRPPPCKFDVTCCSAYCSVQNLAHLGGL
jgi:hypothetical protein